MSLGVGCLHVNNLFNAKALWRDEVGDVVYASMPSYQHIWSMLKYDNFPPLLLVLLRGWHGLGLGESDLSFRVYGCIMGLLIVGALFLNARLLGRGMPWFSLSLFATCGMAVRYGDSIRPYAPGWLFMLLTFGLIWRVVLAPRVDRIVLAGFMAVLSVQSLYQNAFLVLGMGAAGIFVAANARRWRAAAAVTGISLAAALSLIPYGIGPIHDAKPWGIITQTGLTWKHMAAMAWQATATTSMLLPWAWIVALLALIWIVVQTRSTCPSLREERAGSGLRSDQTEAHDLPWRDVLLYGGLSVTIGIGSFLLFLKFLGLPTMPWYYLLPMALLASTMDATVRLIDRHNTWRIARLASFVIMLAVTLPGGRRQTSARMTDVDLLAQMVTTQATPGDFVVVNRWYIGVSFCYYYKGLVPWETVPPLPDHTIHRYDLVMECIKSPEPMSPLLARVRETLQAGHRVWLVGGLEVTPDNQPPTRLQPGPDPDVGWDEETYSTSWSLQLGDFLRAHAMEGRAFQPNTLQAINGMEALHLFSFKGWQP